MKINKEKSEVSILRQKALVLLENKSTNSVSRFPETETLKLIHELEVHQIELELQNEELMLAKSALQDVSENYARLYDFAPSGYYSLSREGEIIELNLCGAQMLGNERSRLKNSKFGFFVSNNTKPIFNLFLEKVFSSNVKESCKITLLANDKISMYVYLSGIVSNNGEQCLVSVVDITELNQVEQELIKAKEKSEESDHLKSAFLANMSHEIRTPMNGILGFTELLKTHELTGEKQQKYISMIEKGGARLLNIINDLINISKIESGQTNVHISACNVNEQIEYIYNFFKPEVERKGMHLLVQSSLSSKEAIIQTDCDKILAILTNLVKKAIKYSDKGTIEFGYYLNPTGVTIVKPLREPEELTFFVKDTGIGIPQEKLKVIFDRFVQANIGDTRLFQGAGLGLAISKAYVEMLGGKIWVESEEGKGSTFLFTVPYNAQPEVKTASNVAFSSEVVEKKIKKLKILIAEDDESSAFFQTEIVKTHCSTILYAVTGIEAVEACRSNTDIDLILMDIQMPEMNGHEATRQIRQFNKDIIIIAQTANSHSCDREKALEAGCNDYIAKPYNRASMIEIINKHFNKT